MRVRTRTAMAALPVALVLAVTLSGCGSDGGDRNEVASAATAGAGGGSAGKGGEAGAELSPEEQGLKFARCMRKNGVPMEDPVDGRVMVSRKQGEDTAVLDKAMKACREFQPRGGSRSGPREGGDDSAMRKFAVCMRENGVAEFPDPDPGSGAVRAEKPPTGDPDFEKAEEKCHGLLGGARTEGKRP
ncbi:hypothetical protein [Streptomyces sp. CAU 1734]|uniref:hypothetical protein n=1 Tax=Streptomyces sp. CAU 1734 TaxID=3140360 RepID=UPI0032615EA7